MYKLNTQADAPLLKIRDLTKVYHLGRDFWALRGVNMDINRGELVSIVGQSGSGKTTLLNILGCLDHPTGGDYWLGGHYTKGYAALRNWQVCEGLAVRRNDRLSR
jgi:ABC-type lipoprotein export system ATPase subunit